MIQASIDNILELKVAARADGFLIHRPCGGQIVWSSLSSKAMCRGCLESWSYTFLIDRKHALGKPGLLQFIPEMDLVNSDDEKKRGR